MSRASYSLALLGVFGVLLVVGYLASRRDPGFPSHPLAGNVSYVPEGGGNVAVSIGADGVLLVDAKLEKHSDRLQSTVAGLSEEEPAYLINTHWHADHVGGNPRFADTASILAHTRVLERLEEDPTIRGRLAAGLARTGFPKSTYSDERTLTFNGEKIRLIHVPNGHTDGDTVVWFTGSGVVHVGDLFLEGYPPVDTESGGDVQQLVLGLRKLLELLPADVVVLPGHGEPSDIETLRAYTDMIAAVTARVRTHLKNGLDIDGMLAAGVVTDFDARWGQYENVPAREFLESVLASLD